MKFHNLDRLKRKIRALPAAVRNEMRDALQISADEITNLQRRFVPIEDGTLRGTIGHRFEDDRMRVVIEAGGPATTVRVRAGADAEYDYALGQEFGTQKMPANPFFYPGFRLGKRRAKSRISRAINAAAKRVAAS